MTRNISLSKIKKTFSSKTTPVNRSTPQTTTQVTSGKVNYLSGLWLNFDIKPSLAQQGLDIYINNSLMLKDVKLPKNTSVNTDVLVNFDLFLPVQKIAKSIENQRSASIKITTHNKKDNLLTASYNVNDIYTKELEFIGNDINHSITHLPLINKQSISFLSDAQKLQVIDHIYQSKLEKNALASLTLLANSLKSLDNIDDTIINLVKFNQPFIQFLLSLFTTLTNNPYRTLIVDALKSQMYLDAKSAIEYSNLKETDKDELVTLCVKDDQEKFDFIEHFPNDEHLGTPAWYALDTEKKKDYWPMLAAGFEYRRQYSRIKLYSPDLSWYTDQNPDSRKDQLVSIIKSGENKWFGLSLIVHELEIGMSATQLVTLLQEFIWANWSQDFINIDSFCYVIDKLLEQELTSTEYQKLVTVTLDLFNSRLNKNENDIYRRCLILSVAKIINWGITHVDWSFAKLGERVRPYYLMDDDYLAAIDYRSTQRFNPDYYEYINNLVTEVQTTKTFFASLKHDTPPTVSKLRDQFQRLSRLQLVPIYGIEKWILSLSRYCQLHQVTELYPELMHYHEQVEDFYGALILAADAKDKRYYEKKLTEHGSFARRDDHYWFTQALNARRQEKLSDQLGYLGQLHDYLKVIKGSNFDLVELLTSEIIWMAYHRLPKNGKEKKATLFKQVENWLDLVQTYNPVGFTAVQMAYNLNTALNSEGIESLTTQCGTFSDIQKVLDSVDENTSSLVQEQGVQRLTKALHQQYVYPYIQVMIYSCNAYKDTRHKVIRESWLPNLTQLGIDYCFVVGDAKESHMDGDMMRLAVLDTYEELPNKSTEMFRFAHLNSAHRYYYKLDDDCVLNVDAMFGDPAFLGQAYFGRVVRRPLGGVDRSWHHQKSRTAEAKSALDLSPEHSVYCDGSTGYIVSHQAAIELTKQAEDQKNNQLIKASYFEDKLIGDLMALANVPVSEHGYNCVIRRKAAKSIDLQMWDYGLLPTAENNIKVLHTESDEFRKKIGKAVNQTYNNIPHLIYRDAASSCHPNWPSAQEQTPVIEKYRVQDDKIRQSKVLGVIVGKNEQELLPNLLTHHRSIGVEHFIFVDNCSDDESIEYMSSQDDVSIFIATQEYKHSRFAVNWQETLLTHYGLGRWVLIIDSDELYSYKNFDKHPITTRIKAAENESATAFYAPMVDYYPKGDLSRADVTVNQPFYETCSYFDPIESMTHDKPNELGPFSNSVTLQGGVRLRIFGKYNPYPQPNYVNQKYNLLRYQPNMRLIEGLHYMYGHKTCSVSNEIMHFKYHSGFHKKVLREIESGQHWNGATEYKRYADKLENNKYFSIDSENISCKKEGK